MRKLFRQREVPTWWITTAAGLLACFVLFFRLGGTGFWDPWEMNHEITARQTAGPTLVLVVAPQSDPNSDKIQLSFENHPDLDVSWLAERSENAKTSKASSIKSRLAQARSQLTARPFHSLIIPLGETSVPSDQKLWTDFARELRSNLPGTKVLLIGVDGFEQEALKTEGVDARTVDNSVLLEEELGGLARLSKTLVRVRTPQGVFGMPPLRYWLVNASHYVFGQSEFSSRFPGAVLGFIVAMIVFFLTRSLAGPWSGLLAVSILLGTPYLTVQARSMGGDIGFIAYLTLGVWGLYQSLKQRWLSASVILAIAFAALLFEKGLFGPAMLSLIALGLTLMDGRRNRTLLWLSCGIWLALAVSFVLILSPNFFGESDAVSWRSNVVGVLMALATLSTSLAVYASLASSKPDGDEGEKSSRDWSIPALWVSLSLWVLTVVAAGAFLRTVDWSFAAHLRATSHPFEGGPGSHDRGFDFFMLQTGFAFLPWIILVPFSLAHIAQERDDGDGAARSLVILWASIPFVIVCASILHLGHSVYPGGPAFAIAVALFAAYLYRGEGLTPLHGLFIFLGLYLLLSELKLSPHPLVGTISWDPSFVFAFKEIHRGVLYPEAVQIPSLYRYVGLLFLMVLMYGALKGSNWFARARELSRSSRFYFFVLASLLFLALIAPVYALISYVYSSATVEGGSAAYEVMRGLNSLAFGHPSRVFLLLLLVAYTVTGIVRSQWATQLLHHRQSTWTSGLKVALHSLGWLHDEEGKSVLSGKQASYIRSVLALVTGLVFMGLTIQSSSMSSLLIGLLDPLVLFSLGFLIAFAVYRRESLRGEMWLALATAWFFLFSLSSMWGGGGALSLGTQLTGLGLAFVVLTQVWPIIFRSNMVRRGVLVVGILLLGLHFLMALGALSDQVSLITKSPARVQSELGLALMWRPEMLLIFAIAAWSSLGWIRMGPALAHEYGANRLILGLALCFVGIAAILAVGASMGATQGGSQVFRVALWVPLALLILLVTGVTVSIRPEVDDWKKRFVQLTQWLEKPVVTFVTLAFFALVMNGILNFKFVPQLGHHVSQKHLWEHYQAVEHRSDIGSNLFRYGQFSTHTNENNIYAAMIPNVRDTGTVLNILDARKDLHVPTGIRGKSGTSQSVFLSAFDPANDVDSDGVRDWRTDSGVADSIESNTVVDKSKSWKPDQWKGAILIDGTGRVRKRRVVSGNTENELTFKGPPMLSKPGVPDGWYQLDSPEAVNHKATSEAPSRSYVVFPVKDFSDLNFKYRKKHKGAGIPVLDNRSSRQLLLASSLREGEENLNWLDQLILTQAEFDAVENVQKREIVFDDKIVLIGVKVDESLVWRTKTAKVTFYFKVKAGLAKSWKLFVHVDRVGGARIGADHWIANLATSEEEKNCTGCFKTNHWMVGDIIADHFEVPIPMAHSPGLHRIHMGMYDPNATQRLRITDVKPPTKHNGDHRVEVGSFVVR